MQYSLFKYIPKPNPGWFRWWFRWFQWWFRWWFRWFRGDSGDSGESCHPSEVSPDSCSMCCSIKRNWSLFCLHGSDWSKCKWAVQTISKPLSYLPSLRGSHSRGYFREYSLLSVGSRDLNLPTTTTLIIFTKSWTSKIYPSLSTKISKILRKLTALLPLQYRETNHLHLPFFLVIRSFFSSCWRSGTSKFSVSR